ncbi:FR47-like protein [Actinoplanes philippinensis]|uniref:FR47-like protein n=1 Tax=Actinoplanes philippinensis TaxID=35752 RepID=A0A1I2M3X0_9ACTN|nr:FR47-like protein [Actinoplanes philippinensis]
MACAALSRWDRLVINGEPEAVAGLLRQVLAETGETFRPFGTEELVTEVVARIPELEVSATFAWMETTEPVKRARTGADGPGRGRAHAGGSESGRSRGDGSESGRACGDGSDRGRARGDGLESGGAHAAGGAVQANAAEVLEGSATQADEAGVVGGSATEADERAGTGAAGLRPVWLGKQEWPEVTALIREAYPESYAWPGDPAVRRWAGIRGLDGELLTVAAEAWSTPEIGFMSGVATRPAARGRGLGADICAFVADELLPGRERVALLVDYWNTAAVATYTGLGFATRRVAAARRR